MTFTVGETVVYPNHGAAVIEDIEMRTIKGEEKQYLVLRIVAQQDLVVRVPCSRPLCSWVAVLSMEDHQGEVCGGRRSARSALAAQGSGSCQAPKPPLTCTNTGKVPSSTVLD